MNEQPPGPPPSGPPPSGPPPSGPPPSGPPPSGPPPTGRGARRFLPLLVAAVVGVLVGVIATLAISAAVGGDDDVDAACRLVDAMDPDDPLGDGVKGDSYRLIAAGSLLVAAGDGDTDSEPGKLGTALSAGVQTLDEDGVAEAIEDAQDYCDDH